ncbi:MAG: ABC transporter ATP-binding protein [Tissierellia bacterium]|nr:ABC transporter ATP-binding protein [Tissierellia bacterium]
MEVVRAIHLNKTYHSGAVPVEAIKDVNLMIKKGEFIVIIGPSGSGKSTLLHMLGGVEAPTAGEVLIDGVNIHALSDHDISIFRRRRIGFIFQFFNLVPVLTAEENLMLPLLLDRRRVDRAYSNHLIDMLGLADRLQFLPSQLSGGEQQRVAIGRALITKPSIVLADEPTGNLDTQTTQEIIRLIKLSAKMFNQTVIMITHNPELTQHADRVLRIVDGQIVGDPYD